MTAKTQRKEGVIDCTGGVSREQRAINRRNKLDSLSSSGSDGRKRSSDAPKRYKGLNRVMKRIHKLQEEQAALDKFCKQLCAEGEKRYGGLPDRVATDSNFEEKPFGYAVKTSANDSPILSRIVVSLALFDGDKMLFACSGIPLQDTNPSKLHLTRFVTSARLTTEFHANRYRDDKLRVKVRLPHNQTLDGLLGLYDEDIAIVTSLCLLDVHPVELNRSVPLDLPTRQVCDDDRVLAIGCLYKSDTLMATEGSLHREQPETWVSDTPDLSEAVLGGPLIGNGATFLGMNHKQHGDANVTFLSQKFLRERLEHFQILNPKELHFRGYSLPKDVSRIVPSGFLSTINWIKSCGYPIPPPLVLELNGQLLNRFEDFFGDIIAWKGYSFGSPPRGSECVWKRLPKKVVTDVSHRIVSVASFNGDFNNKCLLIKWHGNKRTVVLTSASFIRSPCNEDDIGSNLTIKVFRPPNHFNGTLEWYNLNYNIAIVSIEKGFRATRREDIFNKEQEPSGKVVAIGRDPVYGLLMASSGEVQYRNKDVKLDCKDLQLSTCKIKKAGIGGPLISLDGSFVGMNFYDGRKVTPFLPKSKICEVLRRVNVQRLPSERGECGQTIPFQDIGEKTDEKKNEWPVPEAFWYHGALDVDQYFVPKLPGRHLD